MADRLEYATPDGKGTLSLSPGGDGLNLEVNGQYVGSFDFYPVIEEGKSPQLLLFDPKCEEPLVKIVFCPDGLRVVVNRHSRLVNDPDDCRGIHHGDMFHVMVDPYEDD